MNRMVLYTFLFLIALGAIVFGYKYFSSEPAKPEPVPVVQAAGCGQVFITGLTVDTVEPGQSFDLRVNGQDKVAWDFGDQTSDTSAGPAASHSYAAVGDYVVHATFGACKAEPFPIYVRNRKVVNLPDPKIVSASGKNKVVVGKPITLKETSGAGHSWAWYNPETAMTEEGNAEHTFTFQNVGDKKVKVFIDGDSKRDVEFLVEVEHEPEPKPSPSPNPRPGPKPHTDPAPPAHQPVTGAMVLADLTDLTKHTGRAPQEVAAADRISRKLKANTQEGPSTPVTITNTGEQKTLGELFAQMDGAKIRFADVKVENAKSWRASKIIVTLK